MHKGPSYLNLVLRVGSQGTSSQPMMFTRSQSQRNRASAAAAPRSQAQPPPMVTSQLQEVVSAPGPLLELTSHISHTPTSTLTSHTPTSTLTTHISLSPPHTCTYTLAPSINASEDVGSAPSSHLNMSESYDYS